MPKPNTHEPTIIQLEGQIIEARDMSQSDQPGHEVRATVIRGGKSKNGYSYDAKALQTIANMLEGAHAYADHSQSDALTRSVRDIIGFYHNAQYIPASQDEQSTGRVDADLHLFESADWLWSLIQEAAAVKRPELIGLSIDILGQWQHNRESQAKDITQIIALNSCDVVTRPSAGGAFKRILHHETNDQGDTNDMPEEQTTHVQNSQQNTNPPAIPPTTPATAAPTTTPTSQSHILEQQQQLEQLRVQVEQQLKDARQQRAELCLERRLQESILPSAVKDQIKNRFTGRIFEESELDADMTQALSMMAQLAKDGLIRGNNYEKTVSGMVSEAEKVQAAMDRMFDLEIDTTRLGNIRPFGGIREAYARVTGDSSALGGITGNTTLGQIRVSESAPVTRITEADTTTASFSYLLGSSMNKRLLKDYAAWPAEWMKFVTVAPIRDFKQQSRIRFGAFASLSIVPEDSAYTSVSLTDSAATYVPQKRGNIVTVSREVIINDDLMAVKQIPTKLAVAAAYTLAEFVYTFISGNGNIYDGNALFTSGGGSHLNLGSTALSTAAMQTGVTAMREQTNYAGKRIGLRPRYLIVPPELEWTAMVATKSAGVPGSTNNDINPMLGYVVPIVSPQLSSATQWFMAADPREVDTIEVGFVGGQMNPALFIQDQPLFGLNFTQDVITYKIRHEYGGAVVDYRGLYRGI